MRNAIDIIGETISGSSMDVSVEQLQLDLSDHRRNCTAHKRRCPYEERLESALRRYDDMDSLFSRLDEPEPSIPMSQHGMFSSLPQGSSPRQMDADALVGACGKVGVRLVPKGTVESGRWNGTKSPRQRYAVVDSGTGLAASSRAGMDDFVLTRPEECMTFSSMADAKAVARAVSVANGRGFDVVESSDLVAGRTGGPAVSRGAKRRVVSFPKSLSESDLDGFMVTMNGSTKPYVGVIGGQMFVAKRGSHTSNEHVENESIANKAHLDVGLNAPRSRTYTLPSGEKVMLAEYIPDGRSLSVAWSEADDRMKEKIRSQVCRAYPFEAFIAGIDVFQNDNAIVDGDGRLWFVDNGASFDFRARGGRKGWFNDRRNLDDPDTGLMSMYNHKDQSLLREVMGEANLVGVLSEASRYDFPAVVSSLPRQYQTPGLRKYADALARTAKTCAYPKSVESRFHREKGDITKFRGDAIVNAANRFVLGGGGVDGAIHDAAGPALLAECRKLPVLDNLGTRCETGDAKVTGAGKLPTRYVIHTVGPDVRGGMTTEAPKLLASAYRRSLEEAARVGARSVAFPSISTGIYAFPKQEADAIAEKTVKDFLVTHPDMDVTLLSFN